MLEKSKLNSKELVISKALIDSNISHDEFVLIKNVLKDIFKSSNLSQKGRKDIAITNAFQKVLDESNCKQNKI